MYNKAINIKWETDGEIVDLPSEVDLPIGIAELEDEEANYESVNNYLSDKYGWLVQDYDLVKADPVMIVDEGVSEDEAKMELVKDIENILSEMENEDETIGNLEEAMEYFCGTWDKCEGYKEAIRITLQDQSENHIGDLEIADLQTLKAKLIK